MVNVTGGGSLAAQSRGYSVKEPDLVLSPDLPIEEIITQIDKLF